MHRESILERIEPLMVRPFVEIAKDHGRPIIKRGEMGAYGVQLFLAGAAEQPEMNANDPKIGQIDRHSAARLKPRQIEAMDGFDLGPFAHENGVAVPADGDGRSVDGEGYEIRVGLDHARGQRGGTGAEPHVGFLERDDIGSDPVDHIENTSGRALAVRAATFAQIIGGEPHGGGFHFRFHKDKIRPRAPNFIGYGGQMHQLFRRYRQEPLVMRLVWLALFVEFIVSLFTARYSTAFVALGTFGLTLLPMAFAHRFQIYIPRSFMAAIVVFLFATLFLGEVDDFYYRYWWWDVVLHGGSALAFGLVGFVAIFMLFQGDRYAAPPWAMGLFAFCFAMSIGALWEIFEYSMDQIFGTNMQKSGLQDTMWDLIVDAGGGFIGALSGVVYLKRDSGTPFAGLIRDFVQRNSKFFAKYRDK